MIGQAFAVGVAAALKFFSRPQTQQALAKAAQSVQRNLTKAAKAAAAGASKVKVR